MSEMMFARNVTGSTLAESGSVNNLVETPWGLGYAAKLTANPRVPSTMVSSIWHASNPTDRCCIYRAHTGVHLGYDGFGI